MYVETAWTFFVGLGKGINQTGLQIKKYLRGAEEEHRIGKHYNR